MEKKINKKVLVNVLSSSEWKLNLKSWQENRHVFFSYPAFLTAPVQLNDAAGFLEPFGEVAPSPGSSSLTAVVNDIRSSSLICN